MKHVNPYQTNMCIVKHSEEFEQDVKEAFGEDAYVVFSDAGIMVYRSNETPELDDDECLSSDYIRDILSIYYDVTITSLHFDQTDFVTVWLAYKR